MYSFHPDSPAFRAGGSATVPCCPFRFICVLCGLYRQSKQSDTSNDLFKNKQNLTDNKISDDESSGYEWSDCLVICATLSWLNWEKMPRNKLFLLFLLKTDNEGTTLSGINEYPKSMF